MRAAILLLVTGSLVAQERGPLQLSMKRSVELATRAEGNTNLQLAGEEVKQAQSQSAEARAALLPDLESAFRYQDQTANLEAYGFRLVTPFPGVSIPAFVGPFNVMDARISAQQSVFDFSSIKRFEASRKGVSAAKSNVDATDEQVAGRVARAYLAAAKAAADVETAEANVALSEALLKQAENQKAAGTGTGIEITRARALLSGDRQRLLVAQNQRSRTNLELLRAMNMRLDIDLALTDKLSYVPVDAVALEQARKIALEQRADYRAQQEREVDASLAATAVKMERLPTLAAFGDYGSSGTGFSNSLPTRTYGLSVKVPIFDGGRKDARRAESASQYRSAKLQTNDLKEQIELEVRLAFEDLSSAEDEVKVAREGVDLADNELAQARRRFEAGVAINLEVTDAQTRLERARESQNAALYNHNLARIELSQAMGKVRQAIP